jgi:hypothetical protein
MDNANPGLAICATCKPNIQRTVEDDMLLYDPNVSVFRALKKVNPVVVEEEDPANDHVILDNKLGYSFDIQRVRIRRLTLTEWIIGIQLQNRRTLFMEQRRLQDCQATKTQLALFRTENKNKRSLNSQK